MPPFISESSACARAPRRVNPLFEIDLRDDEHERERCAMEKYAKQQGGLVFERGQSKPQHAEREAAGKNPFQPPVQQQPAEAEHGDDLEVCARLNHALVCVRPRSRSCVGANG